MNASTKISRYIVTRGTPSLRKWMSPAMTSKINMPSSWLISSDTTYSRSFSSPGFFERVKGTFSNKTDQKKAEQIKEQLMKMSDYEVWNLKTYALDLEASMSDWKTKLPGMGYTNQVKTMKEAQKVLQAVLSYVGDNATADILENLSRRDKLKIAVEGDIHVEDIDTMIAQFQNMQLMHKVLRYRKKEGKSIPKDEASMTLAVQQDAIKVMTKQERSKMAKTMQAKAMRGMR